MEIQSESKPVMGLSETEEWLSLADLRQLPLDLRCAKVLGYGGPALDSALRAMKQEGPPSFASMDAERVAWALAFNVEGPRSSDGGASLSRRPGMAGYCDRWPADTRWEVVWSIFRRPLAADPAGNVPTLLRELAISVAAEQRDEWQNPRARPINPSEANECFEWLYRENQQKVLAFVGSSFGTGAGAPQDFANEAWSRVFCDYWSANARRRFLGLCRISTLVCQVARYVVVDAMRESSQPQESEGTGEGSKSRRVSLSREEWEELGITNDPASQTAVVELQQEIRDGMQKLPPRQRVVAEMVWFQDLSAKRTAEILRISEPAVSQHLRKAREFMRVWLKGHGLKEGKTLR